MRSIKFAELGQGPKLQRGPLPPPVVKPAPTPPMPMPSPQAAPPLK
jgi:hypothetical protein